MERADARLHRGGNAAQNWGGCSTSAITVASLYLGVVGVKSY